MSGEDGDCVEREALLTLTTPLNADSVEWCPIEPYHRVLAGGSYQLQEAQGNQVAKRMGQIQMYELKTGDDDNASPRLAKNSCLEVEGVLDMKWSERTMGERPVLGVADAGGSLTLYSLDESGGKLEERVKFERDDDNGEVLALSLSWDESNQTDQLAVSYSNGELQLVNADKECTRRWKAHELEAWIVMIDRHNPAVLYSGSDDCLFKRWDVRTSSATLTNRSHEAGVCSMHSHPTNPNIVATGSYDDHIRVWDTRYIHPRRPALHTLHVGGGVWRLKWRPDNGEHLLAACMYNGVTVVGFDDDDQLKHSPKIISRFTKHESMAYGADWCRHRSDKHDVGCFIATCSFYDNKLCLWKSK